MYSSLVVHRAVCCIIVMTIFR